MPELGTIMVGEPLYKDKDCKQIAYCPFLSGDMCCTSCLAAIKENAFNQNKMPSSIHAKEYTCARMSYLELESMRPLKGNGSGYKIYSRIVKPVRMYLPVRTEGVNDGD